uniref:Putative DNA polymerase n=1 Tax=viral metagenome TaxID=1070528 RepID=A0A6H1ZLE6_9ZZZZ
MELEQGEPFVGPSGKFLNHMLRVCGIQRESCYITNVIKHYLPKDKLDSLKPGDYENSLKELTTELSGIECNVIVALGGIALTALCHDKTGIDKWRGSILEPTLNVPQTKVVPTLHPARVLHSGDYRFKSIIEFDLQRALEECANTALHRPSYTLLTQPRLREVLDFCEWLQSPGVPFVTCDIEMLGGTDSGAKISAVGFAGSRDKALCIPFMEYDHDYWPLEEEVQVWSAIAKVIRTKPINNQNVYFDLYHLRKVGVHHTLVHMDTMAAHALMWPELPHSLAFLTSIYTREPYYKDEGQTWRTGGNLKQYWEYNAKDCITAHRVALALAKELKDEGLYDYYFKMVRPLGEVLFKMSLRGVQVDTEYRRRASYQMFGRVTGLEQTLESAVGYPVNTNPSNALRHFLYADLNLPKRYTKTRTLSTSEDDLLYFYRLTGSDLFHYILNIRNLKKLRGTFFEYKLHPDGRLRCAFKQATDTGRLSSTKAHDGYGTNTQNFPPDARKQVIAGEGKTFVSADLSQVEARIVAYESRDPRLMYVFDSGQDIHLTTASFLFGIPYPELSEMYASGDAEAKRMRTIAKTCVHALNYDMGIPRFYDQLLSRGLYLSRPEVSDIYARYHQTFEGIKRWHMEVQHALNNTRRLENAFGRFRYFLGRMDRETYKTAYAWIPQSTAVEIINRAMIVLDRTLPSGSYLALQLHDEIVVETQERDTERVSNMLRRELERPVPKYNIVVPADVHVAGRWGDLK